MRLAPVFTCRFNGPIELIAVLVMLIRSAPTAAAEVESGRVFQSGANELRYVTPYQAGKVPVVLVHGLLGKPAEWSVMVETLSRDPKIRGSFQFLTFGYDSLRPIPDSARGLVATITAARSQLDPEGSDRAFERVVLVGHSLGGLIAKAGTHTADPSAARAFARVPFRNDAPASPRTGRMIFIATPHRGSTADRREVRLAGRWVAKRLLRESWAPEPQVTSVDQLSWDHPILGDLERARAASGVPFHSIIASLRVPAGEGASDGLVPVASARLDGAQSELFVRTHHYCLQHPDVIGDVRRILRECATTDTPPARLAPAGPFVQLTAPRGATDH